jgi:hypothetical protein
MNAIRLGLALTCSMAASLAPAQSWSIVGNAPVAGSASVLITGSAGPQTASLPAGPVAPGQFLACSATTTSGTASVAATWSPSVVGQVAPLAFTATTQITFQLAHNLAQSTLNAQVDLTLHAPQPTAGRLWVRSIAGLSIASLLGAGISIDVGADGTIEFVAQLGYGPTPGPVDIPLQIAATGTVLRLSFGASAWAYMSPIITTGVLVEAQFFPGEPAVHSFATMGAGAWIAIDHGISGVVTLSIGHANQTPLLLAFGAQPVQVQILPTVTLLVTLDAIFPVGPTITLPLPPMPPGTAIYCQGLVLDSLSTLRSTNSVRALWP